MAISCHIKTTDLLDLVHRPARYLNGVDGQSLKLEWFSVSVNIYPIKSDQLRGLVVRVSDY
jgi:hypothetical protein